MHELLNEIDSLEGQENSIETPGKNGRRLKILYATMQMDIGGVETHVLELSKEMKRRGHNITVASNGGVFEKELDDYGIKHVKLPLHNKKPKNISESHKGLKKLIKQENFDLVHCHARIPAFICGKLHKKLKFRFVTSAHWVFRVNFLWKLLTNWGERTIAVSNDIRKYLVFNYKVPKRNITTTINGIDTEKFTSKIDFSDIQKEFKLSNEKTRIIYVSRMDLDRSAVAYNLINVTVDLYKKSKDLEVIIVGGGNDYDRLSEAASDANKKLGKNVIITTGSRIDVNKFIACGDIFIGVSRAVLEAMSAEKPVIVAGNEGYIGVLTEENLHKAVAANFCCRGCEMPTDELLYSDLKILLSMSSENRKELGSHNRNIIVERYSVRKMTDDHMAMYDDLLSFSQYKKDEIVLSGYYGFSNSGDDAILKMILKGIKDEYPDIGVNVLSNKPTEVKRTFKVNSVSRWNIFSIIKVLKASKVFISGGGSVIQDATSTKSLLYYLSLIILAKMFNNKVMLYANGIGPVAKSRNRRWTKSVLNKVDLITLRDEDSQDVLNELGVINPKITVTCDPVIGISEINKDEIDDILYRYDLLGKDYIIVSLREWKPLPYFDQGLVDSLKAIKIKHSCQLLFVPMQYKQDLEVNKKIANATNSICVEKKLSAEACIGLAQRSKLAVSMRLHLIIYAFTAGISSVGINYDPKIESVMKYFYQDTYLSMLEFTNLNFTSKVDRAIANNTDNKAEILTRLDTLKEKNNTNIKLALSLLDE